MGGVWRTAGSMWHEAYGMLCEAGSRRGMVAEIMTLVDMVV